MADMRSQDPANQVPQLVFEGGEQRSGSSRYRCIGTVSSDLSKGFDCSGQVNAGCFGAFLDRGTSGLCCCTEPKLKQGNASYHNRPLVHNRSPIGSPFRILFSAHQRVRRRNSAPEPAPRGRTRSSPNARFPGDPVQRLVRQFRTIVEPIADHSLRIVETDSFHYE